jgi:hypothetical protein
MASAPEISLYKVEIDKRVEKRMDRERRGLGGNTAIRPAQLTDDGDRIDAVAKITAIDEDDEEIKVKCTVRRTRNM